MRSLAKTTLDWKAVMYNLLLPAVIGTIFWYFIEYIKEKDIISAVTAFVIVYYFVLHFLTGMEIRDYSLFGFFLDFFIVIFVEVYFLFSGPKNYNHVISMTFLILLLISLSIWNAITERAGKRILNQANKYLCCAVIFVIISWISSIFFPTYIEKRLANMTSILVLAVLLTLFLIRERRRN